MSAHIYGWYHGLRTPRGEIAFTARPKIQSQSQIFRYGQSIFCLPHWPNFSDIFDLCLHWVSVVRDQEGLLYLPSHSFAIKFMEKKKKIRRGTCHYFRVLFPSLRRPCTYLFVCAKLVITIKYRSLRSKCFKESKITYLGDRPFKTLANFHNFWPLPPYHRHSSKMLMKGIFDPYVLWPFDHWHLGTPLPP